MGGNFWQAFSEAVEQARKEKRITKAQAARLKISGTVRRKKLRAYCSQQAASAGLVRDAAVGERDGFDWESLLAFIKELLPVILQLISIFG